MTRKGANNDGETGSSMFVVRIIVLKKSDFFPALSLSFSTHIRDNKRERYTKYADKRDART